MTPSSHTKEEWWLINKHFTLDWLPKVKVYSFLGVQCNSKYVKQGRLNNTKTPKQLVPKKELVKFIQ